MRGIDARPGSADDQRVDHDLWPNNRLALSALVALVINDIESRTSADVEDLQRSFFETAWPTARAARQ